LSALCFFNSFSLLISDGILSIDDVIFFFVIRLPYDSYEFLIELAGEINNFFFIFDYFVALDYGFTLSMGGIISIDLPLISFILVYFSPPTSAIIIKLAAGGNEIKDSYSFIN